MFNETVIAMVTNILDRGLKKYNSLLVSLPFKKNIHIHMFTLATFKQI